MATYDINHRPSCLNQDDIVKFAVPRHNALTYKVYGDHLNNRTVGMEHRLNQQVFLDLGFEDGYDGSNLYKFCEQHYGYLTNSGDWPVFHRGDYQAATRLVNALFQRIRMLSVPPEYLQSTANHPNGFIPKRIAEPETEPDDF